MLLQTIFLKITTFSFDYFCVEFWYYLSISPSLMFPAFLKSILDRLRPLLRQHNLKLIHLAVVERLITFASASVEILIPNCVKWRNEKNFQQKNELKSSF